MKVFGLLTALTLISVSMATAANPEWEQATRLYNAGDYKGALTAFRKIADKTPSEPTVHYMLAQCYKNSGNTRQAIIELEWISKSTTNMRVKGPADALLAQLKPAGSSGGIIPGAVSPYQNAGSGGAGGATAAGNNRTTTAGTATTPNNEQPPSKEFVNDSASATVSAAARRGWSPCRGADCLNFGANGWHHAEMAGHPASDNWMDFTREDGTTYRYTQAHIGNLIKKGVDEGPCPVCKGSGWVKSH